MAGTGIAGHEILIGADGNRRWPDAIGPIADGAHDGLPDMLLDLVRDVSAHQKIESIGPITAAALVAAVEDRRCFKNGRQLAAWLGVVPKQRSSDGKTRLFEINKRVIDICAS